MLPEVLSSSGSQGEPETQHDGSESDFNSFFAWRPKIGGDGRANLKDCEDFVNTQLQQYPAHDDLHSSTAKAIWLKQVSK